jgi:replicative DNA helicase
MAEEELVEAEKNILGGAITNKETYFKVVGKLEPDDFFSAGHKTIFADLKEFYGKGGAGSSDFLEYLKSKKDLEKVGGQDYIVNLCSYQPLSDELDFGINIIKDKSLARTFFAALHTIEDDYKNKSIDDISGFIGDSEKKILDITSKRRVSEFQTTGEVIKALKEKSKEDFQRRQQLNITDSYMSGYSCGYEDLDRLTTGFHPQDLIILAARPSVGKTAFALNIAERMARSGRTVGIFSLEMPAIRIMQRMLSEVSGVPTNAILSYDFEHMATSYGGQDDNKLKVLAAMDTLEREKILIDDTSAQKLIDISSKARKLKARYPDLSFIVIDYLGLITNPSKSNGGSRQEEVSEITRGLKQMARDLDVPVMVLCQLSRGVEKRNSHVPALADLRDSGSIEQDADMVFFIYRPDYYKDADASEEQRPGSYQKQPERPAPQEQKKDDNDPVSQTTIYLSKNRNGSIGHVDFTFYRDVCRFQAVVDSEKFGDSEPD